MTADGPAVMERLAAELATLRRENQQLLARIEAVERGDAGRTRASRGGESTRGRDPESRAGSSAGDSEPARNGAGFSRRSLMRRGGVAALAGLGAAAAGSLLVAAPVAATDNTTLVGGTTNTTTQPTAIAVSDSASSSGEYGFGVTDHGLSAFPESAALAGHGNNEYDNAILGYHENGGVGVRGIADKIDGIGVQGSADADGGLGVLGSSLAGTGVKGTSGPPPAIPLLLLGAGVGGVSTIGPGVVGYSTHQPGVAGVGSLLGGLFSGGEAQVNLQPGDRRSHPVKGHRGDLYVDKSGRLWYCRTGGAQATWHQLA